MTFNTYGNKENPSLLLIPGLGVSYEIFQPLIGLLEDNCFIVAVGIDGFLLGKVSQFTSIDDQAAQVAHLLKLCREEVMLFSEVCEIIVQGYDLVFKTLIIS